MIKKSIGILLTAILTMGLAACNNNDNNQLNDQTSDRVGLDTHNGVIDVRNGRDDGIDDNGPFPGDFTNINNNDRDFDVNPINDNRDDRDLDVNLFNDNRNDRRNNDGMISAYQTNLNSSQYPHTRAVLIRDAKYQFIRIDPRQGNWAGIIQQIQPNLQQQTPAGRAPAGQPAPQQAQQPAPKQTAPAPAKPAPKPAQPAPQKPAQTQAPATGTVSQYVQQVIDLTNAQRSKNGLPALKGDAQLSSVAQKKSVDMQQNNYFSHTSPTYGSPFDMMRDFGVSYRSAGENIAKGQRTPQEVVTSWMNSEGHRKNILSRNFTHIGVGYEAAGKHWTQMFIGK